MIASPDVEENIPVKIFISVVLPAPLCPNMAKTSPSFIERFILLIAFKFPKVLVKFLIKIASLSS